MILALDFDGVICDSIEECMVTSYNAYNDLFVRSTEEIDRQFRSYFYQNRHFVRPASGYYILHEAFNRGIQIKDYNHFVSLSNSHATEMIDFELEFFKKRNSLKIHSAQWLALHNIYSHVLEFFAAYDDQAFIVTNKDRDSVEMLLEYFELIKHIKKIYSREDSEDKAELFELLISEVKDERGSEPIVFVDDNVNHLEDLQQYPIQLYYAAWGYSGPGKAHKYIEIKTLQELI